MHKKISFIGIILALLLMTINSAFALTATNTNPTPGTPGASVSGSVVLTDSIVNGNNVTALSLSSANLVGVSDGTKSILSSLVSFSAPSPTLPLTDGQSTTVTSTVAIPNDLTLIRQSYQGLVTVTGTEGGSAITPVTFTLSVTVNSPIDVLTYDNATALELIGEEGETNVTGTFQIKNIGKSLLIKCTREWHKN